MIRLSAIACCNLLLILILMSAGRLTAQEDLGLRVGGAGRDIGAGIIIDGNGDLIIGGTTRSYGNGGDDFILVKLSLEREVIFQKVYQWEHHARAHGIELTRDNNYMLVGEVWDGGYGREDIYLMKIDGSGEKIWENYYGGYHTDQGFDVESLEDGFLALGYTSSQPETTRGNYYLVRTDLEGNKIWENNYGTEFLDFGFSILPEENGEIWLLGAQGGFFNHARADYMNPDSDMMLIRTDKNGNEIFRNYFGGILHDWGKDMIKADNGGLYLFGSTQSKGAGSFDMYLVKTDQNGNKMWERTYGESDFEYGNALSMDPAGNIFLLGTRQLPDLDTGPDIYIVKANQEGEIIWEQTIGGSGSDYGYDLVSLPDSGCIIVGETENIETQRSDIFVVRLDKNGQIMSIDVPPSIIEDAVKFFPNPVSDQASIEWKGLPPPDGFKLLVFSLSGQLLHNKEFSGEKKIELELGHLPAGTYLYQLIYSGKKLSGKFMTR